jgi:hypothetical protein
LWIEPAVRVRRRKDRAKLAADEPRVFREETGSRTRKSSLWIFRPTGTREPLDGPSITGRFAGVPGLLLHGHYCRRRLPLRYTRVTPHDEFKLIRDNDPAAAIALGLSLLGFVLPLVSAITVRPPRQVGKWCVRSK